MQRAALGKQGDKVKTFPWPQLSKLNQNGGNFYAAIALIR